VRSPALGAEPGQISWFSHGSRTTRRKKRGIARGGSPRRFHPNRCSGWGSTARGAVTPTKAMPRRKKSNQKPCNLVNAKRGWQPRGYGEESASSIDSAVHDLIDAAFKSAVAILTVNRAVLVEAAALLLAKETLAGDELRQISSKVVMPGSPAKNGRSSPQHRAVNITSHKTLRFHLRKRARLPAASTSVWASSGRH